MHEFMPLKPFLVLSQWTCQIHLFRSKTHVLGGSMPFRSRTWHVPKIGIEVHLMHEFMPLDLFLVFSANMPNPLLKSQTHVLDGFSQFHCRTWPVTKICNRVQLMHEFMPPKPFLVWSQRTCPIHYFRSKTHFTILFDTPIHFCIAFDDS